LVFVLDASVALAWCFEDQGTPFTDSVLDRLSDERAIAPGIWPLEVANVLAEAQRRGRLAPADTARLVQLLRSLPIEIESSSLDDVLGEIFSLAVDQELTSYDAAYLALSMRHGVPLASLDAGVRRASGRLGVTLLE